MSGRSSSSDKSFDDSHNNSIEHKSSDEYLYEKSVWPGWIIFWSIVFSLASCICWSDGIVGINWVILTMIFVIVSIIGSIVYWVLDKHIYKEYKQKVIIASRRYRYLKKLYESLNISNINMDDEYEYKCSNLQQFKNFNYQKRLFDYLKEIDAYDDYVDARNRLDEYADNFYDVPDLVSPALLIKGFSPEKVNYNKFHDLERKMCEPYEYICSDNCILTFIASYRSPGGRNNYKDSEEFDINQIIEFYEMIQESVKNKKRKRTITAKQRQRILRRDHFTCCLCGAKGPGAGGDAVLHVDHKLPFSKGGTDEDDNLWILCEACNLGKSNDYDDSDK